MKETTKIFWILKWRESRKFLFYLLLFLVNSFLLSLVFEKLKAGGESNFLFNNPYHVNALLAVLLVSAFWCVVFIIYLVGGEFITWINKNRKLARRISQHRASHMNLTGRKVSLDGIPE